MNLAQEIIALIGMAGTYGVDLYLKLKAIGELGADEQENIHRAITEGVAFDVSVKQRYSDWRATVGLPALPELPPAKVGPGAPILPVAKPPSEGSD